MRYSRLKIRATPLGLSGAALSLALALAVAGGFGWVDRAAAAETVAANADWPAVTAQARPWAYWWWLGSAVDPTNLTRELTRYHDAGLGGVHIIPIYGAKGWEDKYISYLSPQWMEMLNYSVTEGRRLGMGVDMTMGSGWCFGGPKVSDADANALAVVKTYDISAGARLTQQIDPKLTQALVAFSSDGKCIDLTSRITADRTLDWSPTNGAWQVYAVSRRPSGQKVKRAGKGGEGHMLNLFYPEAMRHYLQWFDDAFGHYTGAMPRAMYHDSYEYRSDWVPDLFAAFAKRRSYRLETELPALFGPQSDTNQSSLATGDLSVDTQQDHVARVKCDYRETLSDVMAEESLPLWVKWAHDRGMITRNEAHGSPGNWLDLYAVADIPETEMFHRDRNKLVSKFASAAAHVSGRQLVSAETGTWLKEHFTETLGDMKYLLDDLFLTGVNHVLYHGTCYSPDEAGWPGWHFYASYEMNPRNSVWRDVPVLNAYATRCQSVLQSDRPDNDILLYWPVHDYWHNPKGRVQSMSVHAREWFESQPIGQTAEHLWNRGYSFDYISGRQLQNAKIADGQIVVPGGRYRAIVFPPTQHLPVETLSKALELVEAGATVIFEKQLPADVPGWGDLDQRRMQFKKLLGRIQLSAAAGVELANVGRGRVLVGGLGNALAAAQVPREPMFDQPGVMCIRRAFDGGTSYFIANRSEEKPVKGWIPLSVNAQSVLVMDPMTGRTGAGALRKNPEGGTQVQLCLEPGESIILRCSQEPGAGREAWLTWESSGQPIALTDAWKVKFVEGGPELPAPFETQRLASWTELGDTNAQRFAGTALYSLTFDAPLQCAGGCWLDLGRVCQSARVRLNGQDLGTLITPPFRVRVLPKPKDNRLEVEVTNVSANRIRDLDRRGVKWKNFHDINIVGVDYKPLDTSNWPVMDSGLLGPVTLTPVSAAK